MLRAVVPIARPLAPAGASTRRRRISPSHGWKLRLDTGPLDGQARRLDTDWTSPSLTVIDGRPDASKTPSSRLTLSGCAHLALIPVVTVPRGRRRRQALRLMTMMARLATRLRWTTTTSSCCVGIFWCFCYCRCSCCHGQRRVSQLDARAYSKIIKTFTPNNIGLHPNHCSRRRQSRE